MGWVATVGVSAADGVAGVAPEDGLAVGFNDGVGVGRPYGFLTGWATTTRVMTTLFVASESLSLVDSDSVAAAAASSSVRAAAVSTACTGADAAGSKHRSKLGSNSDAGKHKTLQPNSKNSTKQN